MLAPSPDPAKELSSLEDANVLRDRFERHPERRGQFRDRPFAS
jgi:hypothetical protein